MWTAAVFYSAGQSCVSSAAPWGFGRGRAWAAWGIDMNRMDRGSAAMSAAPEPRRLGFLLVPKFAMLAFTSALEPLRAVAAELACRARPIRSA